MSEVEAAAAAAPPAAAPPAAAAPAGKDPKDAKKEKKAKKGLEEEMSGLKVTEPPAFLTDRMAFFDELVERRRAEAAARNEEISVTVQRPGEPEPAVVKGLAGILTGLDVAKAISKDILNDAITVRLNGETVWDIARPLEASCELEFVGFDDPAGKHVFWHSSAHVLGQAMERVCGAHLSHGPPIEEGGFFYDSYIENPEDPTTPYNLRPADLKAIEKEAAKIIKEKQTFQRIEVTKAEGLELFKYNRFKVEMLTEKVPEGAMMSVYRCGTLLDPCRGPHVSSTGRIKAFEVTKNSSSYFKGDAERDAMQRVYGIAFPDKGSLKEWKEFMKLAAERDHRKIGTEQSLFFFHTGISPGSAFWLPHGARIYNRLTDFIKAEYVKRGYQEVITPNLFNSELWETSGHWQHYSEDMFSLDVEGKTWALKPMNCPGHCLMFDHRPRSWRELPWRVADFGVLHRNESSGALTGLTRVRRFAQDDAHIFCTMDQIGSEVDGVLDFMSKVYGIFGFTFSLALSTRPAKALGEVAVWDKAEALMKEALVRFDHPWKINPGDGAFYGPKIDIEVFDALRRKHQCATIQLDFQLPKRFDLAYVSDDSLDREERRPVMIHRAILGSVERMTAILCEHTGGKWPLWLSPRQVVVVPISDTKHGDYANEVRDRIIDAGFFCDADNSGKTMQKKVRESQLACYNYILVVGDTEQEEGTVNVRTRDNTVHGTRSIDAFVEELRVMVKEWK
jgi:threonyl-tRNA synthetase